MHDTQPQPLVKLGQQFVPLAKRLHEPFQFTAFGASIVDSPADFKHVGVRLVITLSHRAVPVIVVLLEFVKYTLDPWVVRWEQAMCRALLARSEKNEVFIKFNVDGLLRGDYVSRMNGYAVARQNGWMSANDIRELENLDRIPEEVGGDLYLINGAMTKLEDAGAFAKPKEREEPKIEQDSS